MYYEVHGSGRAGGVAPRFMTIPKQLDRVDRRTFQTRKVIAVEMQGHGRTADINAIFL